MPKQTFLNLPEEKRKALLQVAIAEFAAHDYKGVSMARIAARAGIAKGSLYQYFEDKKELYLYLLDLAVQEKMAFLSRLEPPNPQMGLFAYLRWLGQAGLEFQLSDPKLARVAYRAYYSDTPFKEEVVDKAQKASRQYFRGLLAQAMARGEVDPGVDPDLVSFVFATIFNEMGMYLFERMGLNPKEVAREGPIAVDSRVLHEILDGILRILSRGIALQPAPPSTRTAGEPGPVE